eukprot:sb/3475295/
MFLILVSSVVVASLVSGEGLKSESGFNLGASGAYCDSPGYDLSVYNSASFEYVGCCPEGTAMMCNPWDAIISGGCCDTSKYDYMDCSWLGFGSCYCYNSADDSSLKPDNVSIMNRPKQVTTNQNSLFR